MYGVDGSLRIHCFAALEDAEPTTLATLGKPSEFVDPGGKNEKRRRMRPKGSRANIPLCPHSGTPAVSGRPHGEPAVHHMSLRSPIQAPSTAGLTSSLAGAGGAKKPGGTNKECLKEWRLNKTGCGGGPADIWEARCVSECAGISERGGRKDKTTGRGRQAGGDEPAFFFLLHAFSTSIFGMLRQPSR